MRRILIRLIAILAVPFLFGCRSPTSEDPITKNPPSNHVKLPSSADGPWTIDSIAVLIVKNSCLIIKDDTCPIEYDPATGSVYPAGTDGFNIPSGIRWSGAAFIIDDDTLVNIPGAGVFQKLPPSADGIWTLGGVPYLEVKDSRLTIGTTSFDAEYDTLTHIVGSAAAGAWSVILLTKWTGSVFIISGDTLVKSSSGGSYVDLPSTADGIWTIGGVAVVFEVKDSRITMNGSTYAIKYDAASGCVYGNQTGEWKMVALLTWNGSAFVMASETLIKK